MTLRLVATALVAAAFLAACGGGDGGIPASWETYGSSEPVRFSFRYPDNWYRLPAGGLVSWDYSSWNDPAFPPDSIKLEASATPLEQAAPRPREAADASLGGVAGWELVREYDPPNADGITRLHGLTVDHQGYQISLIAFFAQDTPDEATFRRIVDSFTLEQ